MQKCALGGADMTLEKIIHETKKVTLLIQKLKASNSELGEYQLQLFEKSLQGLVSAATGLKPNRRDCEQCKGKGYVESTT